MAKSSGCTGQPSLTPLGNGDRTVNVDQPSFKFGEQPPAELLGLLLRVGDALPSSTPSQVVIREWDLGDPLAVGPLVDGSLSGAAPGHRTVQPSRRAVRVRSSTNRFSDDFGMRVAVPIRVATRSPDLSSR